MLEDLDEETRQLFMSHAGNRLTIPNLDEVTIQRFLQFIVKKGPNDCWLWAGISIGKESQFVINGVHYMTARIAWKVYTGEDPGKFDVCHCCDVGRCCNHTHLWLGTASQNMQDRNDKK